MVIEAVKCENSVKKVIADLGFIQFFQCCLLSVRNECCFTLRNLKRPWCWERLKAGEEGDDRGWDGWMASLTQWTWVWVKSGSWWWTGRPVVLWFVGLQSWTRLSDWTELNWKNNLDVIYSLESFLKTHAVDADRMLTGFTLISLGGYLFHLEWEVSHSLGRVFVSGTGLIPG